MQEVPVLQPVLKLNLYVQVIVVHDIPEKKITIYIYLRLWHSKN